MGTVHGTIRVVKVLLAASLTLAAGLPHVSCVCPSGRALSLCPCAWTNAVSCCCCKAAASPSGASGKERSCCDGSHDRQPTGTRHADGKGCQKTLTPSDSLAVVSADAASHPAPDAFVLTTLPEGSSAEIAARAQSWQHTHQPPPTDLVVSLQRLLI